MSEKISLDSSAVFSYYAAVLGGIIPEELHV